MAINNQGPRPNYQSTISPLTHQTKPYRNGQHETFLGTATAQLSEITERELDPHRIFRPSDKHFAKPASPFTGCRNLLVGFCAQFFSRL